MCIISFVALNDVVKFHTEDDDGALRSTHTHTHAPLNCIPSRPQFLVDPCTFHGLSARIKDVDTQRVRLYVYLCVCVYRARQHWLGRVHSTRGPFPHASLLLARQHPCFLCVGLLLIFTLTHAPSPRKSSLSSTFITSSPREHPPPDRHPHTLCLLIIRFIPGQGTRDISAPCRTHMCLYVYVSICVFMCVE